MEDLSLTSFKTLVTAPPSLIYFAVVGAGILLLWLSEPKFGHRCLLLEAESVVTSSETSRGHAFRRPHSTAFAVFDRNRLCRTHAMLWLHSTRTRAKMFPSSQIKKMNAPVH